MSEILELALEFVVNLVVCALETIGDIWLGWLGDFTEPNPRTGSRGRSPHLIFWCAIVVVLGVVICWELH